MAESDEKNQIDKAIIYLVQQDVKYKEALTIPSDIKLDAFKALIIEKLQMKQIVTMVVQDDKQLLGIEDEDDLAYLLQESKQKQLDLRVNYNIDASRKGDKNANEVSEEKEEQIVIRTDTQEFYLDDSVEQTMSDAVIMSETESDKTDTTVDTDKEDIILVTGGVGFIGGHLSHFLLSKGYKIIVYDIFNSETTPSIEKKETAQLLKETAMINKHKGANLKIINGDIRDEEKLQCIMKLEGITACFHIAAMADDRRSVLHPFEYIDTNIKGTVTLLKCLSENGIKTVIQASTRSVFGQVSNNNQLMNEKSQRRPINPYGATKVATDAFAHVYSHLYAMNIAIIRIFATYGPRGRKDMIPRICIDNIYSGKVINKFGDGTATRTWIYIDDVVDAFYLAFEAIKNGKIRGYTEYNIGTDASTTLNEMIETAADVVGKEPIINYLPVPKGDAHNVGYPDWSKIKEDLGWKPKYSLKQGLTKTYNYLLSKKES